MKSTFSIMLFFALLNTGKAQTYFLGAMDAMGDVTQPLSFPPDAKSIYHATDMTADSIWFKMEFYGRINNVSWNVKIGIDTNNNVTDGGTWAGLNTSMKYDLLADVYNNPGFPPPTGNILSGRGAYISSNISISFPDTNILIIGLRLSEIKHPGTPLSYIAGAGIVFGLVNDDIPDTSYITISGATGITKAFENNEILIYPNPAKNELCFSINSISTGSLLQFIITDILGKVVKTGTFNSASHSIVISSLKQQKYFLNISDGKRNYVQQFIKQ
jgi:hypothetical protein